MSCGFTEINGKHIRTCDTSEEGWADARDKSWERFNSWATGTNPNEGIVAVPRTWYNLLAYHFNAGSYWKRSEDVAEKTAIANNTGPLPNIKIEEPNILQAGLVFPNELWRLMEESIPVFQEHLLALDRSRKALPRGVPLPPLFQHSFTQVQQALDEIMLLRQYISEACRAGRDLPAHNSPQIQQMMGEFTSSLRNLLFQIRKGTLHNEAGCIGTAVKEAGSQIRLTIIAWAYENKLALNIADVARSGGQAVVNVARASGKTAADVFRTAAQSSAVSALKDASNSGGPYTKWLIAGAALLAAGTAAYLYFSSDNE